MENPNKMAFFVYGIFYIFSVLVKIGFDRIGSMTFGFRITILCHSVPDHNKFNEKKATPRHSKINFFYCYLLRKTLYITKIMSKFIISFQFFDGQQCSVRAKRSYSS
jgi:hypothetical protein